MNTEALPSTTRLPWSVAPFWQVPRPEPRALQSDQECDTAIVGGGVTGLAIARALCDKQKVLVLESGQLGEGSTGWSAGILSLSTTLDLDQVELHLGEQCARNIAFFLV